MSQAISTTVEVEPKLRVFPYNSELWTTTNSVAVPPVAMSLPTALLAIQLALATPLLTPITAGLPSNLNNIVDISALTVFPSDRNLLKHGIITAPNNSANAPYTILLVGGTGVIKSSFLKFTANVLLGNDIDHYDLDILNPLPNQGGAVGQTALPHLYEIMSISGTLVSARILDQVRRHNLLPRFVSSTHLGWPAPMISSKTRLIKEVL